MNPLTVKHIPALLALLLSVLLAATSPALAGEQGAKSIFTLADAPALAEPFADQPADDDGGADPDPIVPARGCAHAARSSADAFTPRAAKAAVSQAETPYRARAPPAN